MTGSNREARLRYLDASIDILTDGDYVVCAVSGKHIQLSQLKYWSVERQEAYASALIAFERNGAGQTSSENEG